MSEETTETAETAEAPATGEGKKERKKRSGPRSTPKQEAAFAKVILESEDENLIHLNVTRKYKVPRTGEDKSAIGHEIQTTSDQAAELMSTELGETVSRDCADSCRTKFEIEMGRKACDMAVEAAKRKLAEELADFDESDLAELDAEIEAINDQIDALEGVEDYDADDEPSEVTALYDKRAEMVFDEITEDRFRAAFVPKKLWFLKLAPGGGMRESTVKKLLDEKGTKVLAKFM